MPLRRGVGGGRPEEAGPHSTRWLAERHYDKIDAGAVITEGGWTLAPPGSVEPVVVTLTRQDKTSAALELVARGTATHSSRPSPDAAITRLNRAAVRLADYQPGVGLTEVTRAYFEAWAAHTENAKLAAALRLMLIATEQAERDRAGALDTAARETYPDAVVTPGLFEAGTSAGPWRQRGIPVYGIYPYATDADTMSRMHGNDERIRVDALACGTELVYRVFSRFRTS